MRLKVFGVVNLQLLEILNEIFIFEIFRPCNLIHVGKPPCNLIFPHRWPPVATGGPPMASGGLPWVVRTGGLEWNHIISFNLMSFLTQETR